MISKHRSAPPSANGMLDLNLLAELQDLLDDQIRSVDDEEDSDLDSLSAASQEEPTQIAGAAGESNACAD
jgi:hypothetical protein